MFTMLIMLMMILRRMRNFFFFLFFFFLSSPRGIALCKSHYVYYDDYADDDVEEDE